MSEHLGPKAPLRLHMRHAFHDWMWSLGDECGWPRRLARRLPLYFTDPYMDGLPRTIEEFDQMVADGRLTKAEVTTGPPSRTMLFDYTTGKTSPMPQTYGSSSARVVRWS